MKNHTVMHLKRLIFGCFFGIIGLFGMLAPTLNQALVYADEEPAAEVVVDTNEENVEGAENTEITEATEAEQKVEGSGQTCEQTLGAIGWLVCPSTGKIAEAVDWLYETISEYLVVNPVEAKDGSPIYEVWKYIRGITNIVFIIFLLVVIYSQITGVGISNYGIKKALPKLIVAAILMNLSFTICSLAVDVSNIIGSGLRGVFTSIEEATLSSMSIDPNLNASMGDMASAIADGTVLTIAGGVIAFEAGALWMLIPTVLGAIVAVISGLITIALRQAVVALLIMIAPLAIVAYILPNTEDLFNKWKKLLTKMLVFYPVFSLLFGASHLAGWAIIASAKDGFGLLLGVAVQIFPLFFSWKLMSMSGTFLGDINAKIRGLAAKPLATNRAWAESHRDLTKQALLASDRVYTPSLKLRQFLHKHKVARLEETKEHNETAVNRGLAYNASRNYRKDGSLSREGKRAYRAMRQNAEYSKAIEYNKNTLNGGVGGLGRNAKENAELDRLDREMIKAADALSNERARGELIEYKNAKGRHERAMDAINAHLDEKYGYIIDKETGLRVKNPKHAFHFDGERAKLQAEALERYNSMLSIMKGDEYGVQYAAASASHALDTQQKIHDSNMQKFAELLPPTKDVELVLDELISGADKFNNSMAVENIDAIIACWRVLNQRGDTDLVARSVRKMLEHGVELGTHASQALASFAMFEVKGADPAIRRFGKFINLETAQAFNSNKRQNKTVSLDEYVTGKYEETDPNNPGATITRYSKRPMAVLMEGTSLDDIERTGYDSMDEMMRHPFLEDGKLSLESMKDFFRLRNQIDTAIAPAYISACLKYPSGSEQLKSAVKYKTGYTYKMMKDDKTGRVYTDDNGDPLYEWKPIWEEPEEDNPYFADPEYAKEYNRSKTMEYLLMSTPIQILGLRSDFYDPLREHLTATFLKNEDEDLTDEQLLAKRNYLADEARIRAKYGDNPVGEAKKARDLEMRKITDNIAGVQLRKMLEENGTLEQIYRSRRSGAANAAKPWARKWLGLDDEEAIRQYEYKKRIQRKKERAEFEAKMKQQLSQIKQNTNQNTSAAPKKAQKEDEEEEKTTNASDDNTYVPQPANIYDDEDRIELENVIQDMYEREKDDEVAFYNDALDYLIEKLSENSFVVRSLEKRYEDYPEADSHEIKEWLLELLDDPEKY